MLPINFYVETVNNKKLLFAAVSHWQKISLAHEKQTNYWVRTHNTEFNELENALARWMPECLKQSDLNQCISNHILNHSYY